MIYKQPKEERRTSSKALQRQEIHRLPSIAELENRFDIIKNTLANEPYLSRIYFKENDNIGDKDIDVTDILAMLNMFNIDRYSGVSSFPTNSYSAKKKCIDLYIADHKNKGESSENPYVKMIPIMADIFKLYDKIETSMSRFYKAKNSGGRYGAVKGVISPKAETIFTSKFLQNALDMISPNGFIYPILGSFRALVGEKNGVYAWKKDPFEILESVGPDLVESTISMSRSLGNSPQPAGKDANLWKTLYMTVDYMFYHD